MKKTRFAVSIILCLILCLNLMPVYGLDTADVTEIDTIVEGIEENESVDTDVDITEEPEVMPLTPPAGVKAVGTKAGKVKITWNKVLNATGYEVYRCLYRNGQYKYHKTVTDTFYIDEKAYKGEAFYYRIRAINADDDSIKSELSECTMYCMKPAMPVISTKNDNGNITVSWKKVYGAQKYHVYIFNNKTGNYMKVGESETLTYTHNKALKNAFLKYKVKAVYVQEGLVVAGNMSKESEVLSRYVNPNKKMVAFTFDDGPSIYTKSIVDCLFKHNSAATFFVVGNRVNNYKDVIAHTYKMGSELANHSFSHPLLTDLTKDGVKNQIKKTDNRIKAITGEKPVLMRVPYGGHNEMVRKAAGKPLIQWSDDTLDWKTRSKSATVKYVMSHVQDGDIILMHDIHEPTMQAALELIPKLRAKGYQIVTVSELAKYQGYTLKKGKAYSSFR